MGNIHALINQDTYYFAGLDLNTGVWISLNGGSTWLERNQGFPGIPSVGIASLCYHNGFMFAGVIGLSIWRRGYAELLSPVGVQRIDTEIPKNYYLFQNYPNPFNPITNIKFSLSQKSFVKLKILDLLGKEIAILVNEDLSAGVYKYDFNASLLPSGMYFYNLESENFSDTKKMIILK
ncbi:hypothetical protein BH10BAC5_BH10BAC5_28030 [soil metagenome]